MLDRPKQPISFPNGPLKKKKKKACGVSLIFMWLSYACLEKDVLK